MNIFMATEHGHEEVAMSVYDHLVGQGHLVKILEGAVAAARSSADSQEMTHAWVFTGPPGSGRY